MNIKLWIILVVSVVLFFNGKLVTGMVQEESLKILTYNIRYDSPSDGINKWDRRKEWIVSQLKAKDPTVFGIQEGLKQQVDYLQKRLKRYVYVGVGRDDGQEKGEYSPIFFDSTKVKLIKTETFWLSETPEKPSKGWDAALNRICTYALFEEIQKKRRFFVFNTHFDHVGEVARLQSASLILSKLEQQNLDNTPVIVMGDFNLEPESEGIRRIQQKLKDTQKKADLTPKEVQGTFNGFNIEEPATRRIDYIFFGGRGLKMLNSGILVEVKKNRYPSDHFPVYAEFVFE
ncbi:MAG: endonuclease/exonuclease/phosphatase family protein [Bacteroidota bacterium]